MTDSEIRLTAHADPDGTTVSVAWSDLPAAWREDIPGLNRRLASARLPATGELQSGSLELQLDKQSPSAGQFVRDLKHGDFLSAARELAADLKGGRRVLNAELRKEIAATDALLAQGLPIRALDHVTGLIETYGQIPELTLRKALALLAGDKPRLGAVAETLNSGMRRPLTAPERFYDEINRRLRQTSAGRERGNLYRVAAFANWKDHLTRNRRSDDVKARAVGDRLQFEYWTSQVKTGKTVPLEEARSAARDGATFYRQEDIGLNNIDWNAGLEHALGEIISGRFGEVVRLPRGDIAHFKPTHIYDNSQAEATFREVMSRDDVATSAAREYNVYEEDNCLEPGEPRRSECGVYVVIADSEHRR